MQTFLCLCHCCSSLSAVQLYLMHSSESRGHRPVISGAFWTDCLHTYVAHANMQSVAVGCDLIFSPLFLHEVMNAICKITHICGSQMSRPRLRGVAKRVEKGIFKKFSSLHLVSITKIFCICDGQWMTSA